MCVVKFVTFEIWTFKIIMVMLIVIVIRASQLLRFLHMRHCTMNFIHTSANLILTEALGISKYYHSAQFTVKKTEAKRGAGTCQRSHSKWQSWIQHWPAGFQIPAFLPLLLTIV